MTPLKYLLIGLLFLWAAQCRPVDTPTPPLIPSSPLLIPPIQPGDGTDLIDRLLEQGTLRTGIRVWPEAEFSPPIFRGVSNASTGGALTGFEIDTARLLAEGLGLQLELIEADPLRIASGDWRGEWDIALASLVPFDQPFPNPAAQTIVYSRPYAYVPMGIIIPDTRTDLETLAQLAGQRVGVLEHSAYQRLITPGDNLSVQGQPLTPPLPSDLQLIILSNLQKSLRELGQTNIGLNPPVEALFGPTPMFQAAIESGLALKFMAEAKNLGSQPLAIATMPQDELSVDRLVLDINRILERLQRRGTLAEIQLRWYNQDLSQPPHIK